MRRAAIGVCVVVLVGVGVAVGVLISTEDSSDEPRPDPEGAETVELPDPGPDAPPVELILTGEAALVAEFRDITGPLLDLDAASEADRLAVCQTVAAALNDRVDPDALLEAASAIPDPLLVELATDARVAVSETLVACGEGDAAATDEGLLGVAAIDVLFTRRLEQLA